MIHRLTTHRSVWMVDLDAKMVTRLPIGEAPVHERISYSKIGSPRPFVSVKRMPDPRGDYYRFETDEPRGSGFYWFETGTVVEGELPLEEEND